MDLKKDKKTVNQMKIHQESQDEINKRYAELQSSSTTAFATDSKAYRFTNEPFGDYVGADLNLSGPVLTITASGDPICLFAGMGARKIDAVDVSKYANAWAEHKWHGFRDFDLKKFEEIFVSSKTTWGHFPFDLPVSEQARRIYRPFKSKSNLEKKIPGTEELFMSEGYASNTPSSSGYIKEGRFKKMQKTASSTSVRLYPADFTAFLDTEKIPQSHYSAIYISNILDHAVNPSSGKRDYKAEVMIPLIERLVSHLRGDGQLLMNIQWDDRAKPGIIEALGKCDFTLKELKNKHSGCGKMYLAEKA